VGGFIKDFWRASKKPEKGEQCDLGRQRRRIITNGNVEKSSKREPERSRSKTVWYDKKKEN